MRIALAWDLGAGRGHAVRLVALAEHLAEVGHQPIFLARDLRTLRSVIGERWPQLSAPHNDWFPDSPAAASMADVLWIEGGLHDAAQAQAIALSWRDQLRELHVDGLIADGTPLAALAARSIGIPSLAVGTGFTIPPAGPPWPIFRDWEAVDDARIAAREQAIGELLPLIANALGMRHTAARLEADAQSLFTFAALDHYPLRDGGRYVGLLRGSGAAPNWPIGKHRVFVYLQAHYAHLQPLFEALTQRRDVAVLAYFGGARPWPDGNQIRTVDAPLDMQQTLADAALTVTHGGSLAGLAARAGCPMLLLPMQAEMFIMARRLEQLGVGLAATPYQPLDFGTTIDRLLDDPAFAALAAELAATLPQHSDSEIAAHACAPLLDATHSPSMG